MYEYFLRANPQEKGKEKMKIVIIVVCFYATMNILCAQTPGTIKWTFETDSQQDVLKFA